MKGESFKTWAFRLGLNLYPLYFSTGGKALFLKADWTEVRLQLKLNLWTRNYVGTIFGGALFAAADPFPMLMLIHILGKEFVVWDKAGRIDFKRPGRGRLHGGLTYAPEELEDIRARTRASGSIEIHKDIAWLNERGEVVSVVDKTLYVATREHYRRKRAARAAEAPA